LAQAQPGVSSGAAISPPAGGAQSPLILNLSKDARDSRATLDYSLRWDFSDLGSFRPRIKTLYSVFRAAYGWDITENTRLRYYGFKTNPWRAFISSETPAQRPSAGASFEGSKGGSRESKKRLRLSLTPLLDDFKRDLDDNVRDALLSASLKGASPQWSAISAADKRMFFRDVLSLGVLDYDVPVVRESRSGVEYISGEKQGSALR